MAAKYSLQIEGFEVPLSNPDKLLWPELGLTKADYVKLLLPVAPYLIRYCQNRYLTTIRYPDGVHGESFYQKNCPQPTPEFVNTAFHGEHEYVLLNNLPTLIWLANLASLEFHPSLHTIGDELPEQWIIDLDPSIPVEPRIMEAAALVGQLLHSLGIDSVPKTSGATGVQVVIKLQRGPTFAQLKSFGLFVAQYLCQQSPNLFTIERLKKDRGTRIYIDYAQHDIGRTIAAAYTPRATPYATISMPLTWEEVSRNPSPRDFTLLNAATHLSQTGDLLEQAPVQHLTETLQAFQTQLRN
ncbi:non-homologous end-joining DNA ligase [Paenibacillus sp. ACRRX]|uniref:non-homologous end-joining DNA ligase n=1 Tax=Paenibacillus sp. ACRRX TaxID=2918206 RepID=UPI001EF65530|nr:non-homologous end-joining DNA ligase [Paenibacillus sp. ACRRX]MCG7408955.1 non-homologous end-joining DNA ligase [Paenibacillus sp. ACRRX]